MGWTRHVPRKDCKHIRSCKSIRNPADHTASPKPNVSIALTDDGIKYFIQTRADRKRARARKSLEGKIQIQDAKRRRKREEAARIARAEDVVRRKKEEKERQLQEIEDENGSSIRFSLLEMD